MKEKDEESLKRIRDGERVRHHYGVAVVDPQKSTRPGDTQQTHQTHRSFHPRPEDGWLEISKEERRPKE